MKQVTGGVCAAQGFSAAGIHCGIRKNQAKRDLALIYSAVPASAAAVYTTNLVKGAPLTVTKAHLADGKAQAIVCNSGNANTCNADGIAVAEEMSALTAAQLHIAPQDVIVASTGVIGQPLDLAPIRTGLPQLAAALGDHSDQAAEGIMTTDTQPKEIAVQFTAGGKTCTIGGIAKGSGMIHPNLATMPGADFTAFCRALNSVTVWLCRRIAGDGEGATRLIECCVTGAEDHATAKTVAKSIVCSSLVKAAMFGADANWGRVLCAIGYSGTHVDVHKVDVFFRSAAGTVCVCTHGAGVPFSEEEAKQILLEKEIEILVDLNAGDEGATAWGCDLTYDYVKINGDYRT